jgi:hypothetical protein
MSSAPPLTSLSYVLTNDRCVGYLIKRGKTGFEAFDADDRSLGTFAAEDDAVAAVRKGRVS